MNLHNEIINIQIPDEVRDHCTHKDAPNGLQSAFAYKLGHRDARHAAAELSLKAQARIEELEQALQGVYLDSGFRNLCEPLQNKIEELLK